MHPAGPYWLPEHHSNQDGITKFKEAAAEFVKITNLRAVMVAANLWDVVRLQHKLKNEDDPQLTYLPAAETLEWQGHLGDLLDAVGSTFPEAIKIFKTTPTSHPDWPAATWQPVQALNNAGVATATAKHWRIVDVAALTCAFSSAAEYLHDVHHPRRYLTSTVMNMVLHDVLACLR